MRSLGCALATDGQTSLTLTEAIRDAFSAGD
jgi:hypothetical protein